MLIIVCTVFSGLVAVLCVYLTARNEKYQKKAEQRAKQRSKEGNLMLSMVHAIAKLSVGNALALKRGVVNGELEEGLAAVEDAKRNTQNSWNSSRWRI